jgi:hypothetical protein
MTTDQSVSTQTQSVEGQQTNQPASQQADTGFSIPETYKGKGWVEKIKSPDDLWKTLDNAQSLLGKRPAGVPAPDAPDAEWDKFYAAAGRPESADKYNLTDPEGLPEGVDLKEAKSEAMQLMHKAGLTQKQADSLWKEYVATELKSSEKSKESSKAAKAEKDAEFDKLAKEYFGGDFENVSKTAIEFASSVVPEGLRSAFSELGDNPKALAAVAALAKGAKDQIEKIKKEYGAEGSLSSGSQASTKSIEETRTELAKLRVSKEARDFLNPKHKETMAQIEKLSAEVDRYYKSA